MNTQARSGRGVLGPAVKPSDDRLLGWIGRFFQGAALAGLLLFGSYIALRVTGATSENFGQ